LRFGGSGDNNGGVWYTLDDIYLLDNTGTVNNDFLGPQMIEYVVPSGPGSLTEWNPTAGANWENVDETTVLDSNLVSSDAVGAEDFYAMALNHLASTTINGVSVNMVASSTAPLVGITPKLKLNADVIDGATIQRQDVSNRGSNQILVSDSAPDGSGWTPTKFNATEIGFRVANLPTVGP